MLGFFFNWLTKNRQILWSKLKIDNQYYTLFKFIGSYCAWINQVIYSHCNKKIQKYWNWLNCVDDINEEFKSLYENKKVIKIFVNFVPLIQVIKGTD